MGYGKCTNPDESSSSISSRFSKLAVSVVFLSRPLCVQLCYQAICRRVNEYPAPLNQPRINRSHKRRLSVLTDEPASRITPYRPDGVKLVRFAIQGAEAQAPTFRHLPLSSTAHFLPTFAPEKPSMSRIRGKSLIANWT